MDLTTIVIWLLVLWGVLSRLRMVYEIRVMRQYVEEVSDDCYHWMTRALAAEAGLKELNEKVDA